MRLDDEALDLYRNSRHAWHSGRIDDATEFYRRLRRDHALDAYYEINLPEHVRFIHPVGSVLGRADYGDFFVCYHGCGVGSDLDGNRPVIGTGVVLYPGAKVLGRTKIGSNVFITANTVVQNCVVPSNSVVFPHCPDWRLGHSISTCAWRPTKRSVIKHYFPDA